MKKILSVIVVLSFIFTGCFSEKSKTEDTKLEEYKPNPESDFEFYGEENCTITDYIGSGKDVVIPYNIRGKKVTTIEELAFYNNQLTSVNIPSSVTTIGDSAFYGNPLKEIRGKAGSAAEEYAKKYKINFIAE